MALCLLIFCVEFLIKQLCPVLHLLSPAASSSSSSDVPSGLNASGKNPTPAESGPPHRFYIGVALTVGFTLMFVVDQIGGYFSTQGKLAGALSPASLSRNLLKST